MRGQGVLTACAGNYIGTIDARFRFLNVRQSAALAVAILALEAVLSSIAARDPHHPTLLGRLAPSELPSQTHVLSLVVALALLATTPALWKGTRTAVSLASVGLAALAALNLVKGHYGEAVVELTLVVLLAAGRSSFPRGCRNRPHLAMVCAAVAAWGLTYCALLAAPLTHGHVHELAHALHHSVTHALRLTSGPAHLGEVWSSMIEVLLAGAVAISALAVRSLLRPAPAGNHHVEHQYRAARAIVEEHGHDSLAPFVLRPDKALLFAAGGILSYRVIRGTAIVSSDPVAPPGREPEVVAAFLELSPAQRLAGRAVGRLRPASRVLSRPGHADGVHRRGGNRRPGPVQLGGEGGAQAAPVGPPRRSARVGDHSPRRTRDRRRTGGRDRRARGHLAQLAPAASRLCHGHGRLRVPPCSPTTSTRWPAPRRVSWGR